jgi:hypothetical protein
MPEVRFYGPWKSSITITRKGYDAVLTSVPNREIAMAYVMRLGWGQTLTSVQAQAATLSTPVLRMDAREHGPAHARIVLRGEDPADWVRRVRSLYEQGNAVPGLTPPDRRARAVSRAELYRTVERAVIAFRPLVLRAMA